MNIKNRLQKRICRTVGSTLAASLEPLAHRRHVASLSLFHRYYFCGCSSELPELVPLPLSCGRSFVILIDRMIFLSPLLVIRMSTSAVSFLAHNYTLEFSAYGMLSVDL